MDERSYGQLIADDLAAILVKLVQWQDRAIDRGQRTLQEGISRIVEGLIEDIKQVSVQMSEIADLAIIARIYETAARNRPQTHDMETHIKSQPGRFGVVLVGLIDELDKIINPAGYGTFWRAQEYGTGTDQVPGQAGRVIHGIFEPSGTAPDAAQGGLGAGHDLAFYPSADPSAGFGTISVELPGRHFLRDGLAEAGEKWTQRLREIGDKWAGEVDKLAAGGAAAHGRPRNYVAIIDA